MEHYSTRFSTGGGAVVDPMSDRRSRFWQIDSQPAELICPRPRRVSPRPPFLPETINRTLPMYRADPASDVLDLILSKNDPDFDTDSSSQVGFFCGSPPVRANNPVVHDPQFESFRMYIYEVAVCIYILCVYKRSPVNPSSFLQL
ncbi:hypothetical protein E2562_008501 [Oryza meyeriana var. granulata]|uniref:Uncharacterized protein n=1 Tax=Oryza meyeriana var. granulata TaxID=110450 RepID=A0A6G1EIG0_9ORYZ|nr:hypothetical protein E2562_008501 [Oryza meyeriana var. granulata]